MESVSVVVYCDGDMISSFEEILLECPSGPTIVTLSEEDILFDALRKTIMDVIEGYRILPHSFYRQLVLFR